MNRDVIILLAAAPAAAHGAVLGHMTPAQPLTEASIATLPASEQGAWQAYLARSRAAMDADKAALAAERAGLTTVPAAPPHGGGDGGMPRNRPAAWYGTPEARHIADNIVSFQTPSGGWSKNVDRTGPVRQRGQHYVSFDGKESWNFIGTIDNNATTSELKFLARVQSQMAGAAGDEYRKAALRGISYLLNSQYPNGGFPQVYPLQGGYHDAITFNDDAFANVLQALLDVANRKGDYAFVPEAIAADARAAADKAIRVLLASQITIGGVRTAWCQQHDAITLAPVGARNFEPAALTSTESAHLLVRMMQLPDPSPELKASVHAGMAWLLKVALPGDVWSRYYDLNTMKPIFGDRDRSIHDDVKELSEERQKGYGWFSNGPAKAKQAYEAWTRKP
ncbi:MAG TPA: pectate lyase [Pseudoduganella sp.]